MKKPYLLIITTILCLVLAGGMSLANDSNAETIEAGKQTAKKNSDDATAHLIPALPISNQACIKRRLGNSSRQ
ncbi:MAG: hypothetical protein ACYSTS_07440 [Planctomycetota bacterium]